MAYSGTLLSVLKIYLVTPQSNGLTQISLLKTTCFIIPKYLVTAKWNRTACLTGLCISNKNFSQTFIYLGNNGDTRVTIYLQVDLLCTGEQTSSLKQFHWWGHNNYLFLCKNNTKCSRVTYIWWPVVKALLASQTR